MRSSVLALALSACNSATVSTAYRCDVALTDVSPPSASPGDAVALTGTPFTTSWDTAVYVGGTRAVVEDVNRDTCTECDTCKSDASCLLCADCDACDALCEYCVERTTFVVPDMPAGANTVRVLNSHGESDPLPFVVLAKQIDTGDSAADDSGDSGKGDSGTKDSGGSNGP